MARNYVIQVLIAVDQLANSVLGGWADETLSSRSYRLHDNKVWFIAEKVINTLFFFQKDHCRMAYEAELNRKQTFSLKK